MPGTLAKIKLFFYKIFLPVFLVGTIIAAVFIFSAKKPASDLLILFTHDLHSNLDEYAMPLDNGNSVITGGYARLFTAIQKERVGREKDTLVVDAGDFSMGTLFHTIRSSHSPELITMGLMGYDATTFGNHEFEFGLQHLAQCLLTAKANNQGRLPAIIASNIVIDSKIEEPKNFRQACNEYPVLPYMITKRAGLKIGIFALMGKDAAIYAPEAKPVIFSDPLETARKTVKILRDKERVDLIICLSHSGTWLDKAISEDEILAKNVSGIDVIISGHTHSVLDPYIQVGNTCIVSAGCYARYLGYLLIAKNPDNSLRVLSYKIIPITASIIADQKISAFIKSFEKNINAEYLQQFNYYYGQVLAEVDFSLSVPDWDKYPPRTKALTSGIGDLITDAFYYALQETETQDYHEIPLTVEGFGQIRVPLAKGKITVNDVFRLMALGLGPDGLAGSPLVSFWLNKEEIKNMFEIEATLAPSKHDMHLQLTGMRFTYDPKAKPFSRVKKIEVRTLDGSWLSLEDEHLYLVCTDWKFVLMRENLEKISAGKLNFVLKDAAGKNILDIKLTRVFADTKRTQELKSWLALARYLKSFPLGKNNLPEVPDRYRLAEDNVVISE